VCRIEELKTHARQWPESLAAEQEQAH